MTPEQYLHHLAVNGDQLSEIAATADLSTEVPSCPGWDLEQLLTHCAGVWTLVADSIRAGERTAANSAAVAPRSPILSDWHAAAVTDLHRLLADLGSDAEVWTFTPRISTASFWMRRMANESAMHLWDAQGALGDPTPIDAEMAVDGIDEFLEHYIGDRRPDIFAGNGETLHLHSTDAHGEWVITRTAEGIEVEHAHAKGDVAARGPASDLLLMVWGRKLPEDLEVFGEMSLLTEWQEKVRF